MTEGTPVSCVIGWFSTSNPALFHLSLVGFAWQVEEGVPWWSAQQMNPKAPHSERPAWYRCVSEGAQLQLNKVRLGPSARGALCQN